MEDDPRDSIPSRVGFADDDSDLDSDGWNDRLGLPDSFWDDAELDDESFKVMLDIMTNDDDFEEADLAIPFGEEVARAMA